MAKANTIRGTQLTIKVGDGETIEEFAHPCLINTERGIQFTEQGSDVVVPDCDNPDDPAWLEHVKDGLSAAINGAGTLHVNDIAFYDAWFRSPDPKNVQVWVGTHGHWPGEFHCIEFQVTGNRTEKANANIQLRSEGPVGVFIEDEGES